MEFPRYHIYPHGNHDFRRGVSCPYSQRIFVRFKYPLFVRHLQHCVSCFQSRQMLSSWTVHGYSAGDFDHPVSLLQFRERTRRDEEREDKVDKYEPEQLLS